MSHESLGGGEGRGTEVKGHASLCVFHLPSLILFISHAAVPFSCKGWVIFIWHLIICNTTPWKEGRGEGRGREVKGHALLPKEM